MAQKKKTEDVKVIIKRDTDGDGTVDFEDDDDDNDGILDGDDENPKTFDALEVTPSDVPAQIEDIEVKENTNVISTNKPNAKITSDVVNGLSVDEKGNLVGTPEISDEEWGDLEEKAITIKVRVSHDGEDVIEEDVVVRVKRDSDGDKTPDLEDDDDDNDGILDGDDENPKIFDLLSAIVSEVPAQIEGIVVEEDIVVITPNKPNTNIRSNTVNGLTIDEDGKLVGKPKINDWGSNEETRLLTFVVTLTYDTEEITKEVQVSVLRDTDKDKTADIKDSDDDNDGIKDEKDKNPKVYDAKVANTEDKANTSLYAILLALSGSILSLFGIKRRRNEE